MHNKLYPLAVKSFKWHRYFRAKNAREMDYGACMASAVFSVSDLRGLFSGKGSDFPESLYFNNNLNFCGNPPKVLQFVTPVSSKESIFHECSLHQASQQIGKTFLQILFLSFNIKSFHANSSKQEKKNWDRWIYYDLWLLSSTELRLLPSLRLNRSINCENRWCIAFSCEVFSGEAWKVSGKANNLLSDINPCLLSGLATWIT